jgi:import receptor subunit TOM20
VANKDLKAGDELTIAFVDVTQHLEETAGEARRRRRWELARGWRFACTCDKCMSENIPAAAEGETEEAPVEEADQAEPELKDESKVEEIALKYDA